MKYVAAVLARLGGLKGFRHYLAVRSEQHTVLEKERERNRDFAAQREGRRDIAGLIDYEDHDGRRLWIRARGREDSRPNIPSPPVLPLEPVADDSHSACQTQQARR